jgi:prepilin-type N-terminal cleavage/methylation domain-containing protein
MDAVIPPHALCHGTRFRSSPAIHPRRTAFSLIEMLAVLGIFAILATLVLVSYVDWDRPEGLRGSLHAVKAGLREARQYAVTQGRPVAFVYRNAGNPARGLWLLTNRADGVIGLTNRLVQGFAFDPTNGSLVFLADGQLQAPESESARKLSIVRAVTVTNAATRAALTIHRLTGGVTDAND